jgi:putative NADH-flavin reductase
MKIALLGANGRTGRGILTQALSAGDTVTALVRAEDRLSDVKHARLQVRVGSACDSEFLAAILPGHDVVISTLGPRKPTKSACTIYPESAAALVETMEKSDVRRLLVSSTALLFPDSTFSDSLLRWVARNNPQQAGLMEERIRSSSLEWTIARTGFLTNGSSTDYRAANGAFPEEGGSISRAAVARFFLTEAKQSSHLRQIVGLCG